MPKTVIEYSVLIASPADVLNECRIVKQAIENWNASIGQTLGIRLFPVTWESNATPRMGDKPQTIINEELVSKCDILIGIFWTRLGSPTETEESGTVEEIKQFVKSKKPALVYFSSVPINPNKIDIEQHRKLSEFKCFAKQNGLLGDFDTTEELRTKLQADLTRTITYIQEIAKVAQDTLSKVNYNSSILNEDGIICETNTKRVPFEALSRKDRDFWRTRALQFLIEQGATTIGPNAINSMAQGLYREATRTTEDLRQEFLAGQRAAMRRDRLSEDVKKAASRLPKEGLK